MKTPLSNATFLVNFLLIKVTFFSKRFITYFTNVTLLNYFYNLRITMATNNLIYNFALSRKNK